MNNIALYILTVVIWGSTWIAINYQLGDVAPEASVVYRFGLASVLLFIFCLVRRLPLVFSKQHHLQFLAFGITLFGINYLLLYNAQQLINSALACIAFSSLMLMNIVNARLWYKTKITKQVYFGGLLGLLGIVALFWPQITDLTFGKQTLIGLGLCLIGTLSASFGNMISIRNKQQNLPIMQSNAWGMFYGTLFMALMVLVQGKSFSFSYTLPYISSLLYLSVFGSIIAFGCYLTLMNKVGAHKASYVNIVFPAVAVLISTFVEGFVWTAYTVIGFAFIVLGNLIVLAKPQKKGAWFKKLHVAKLLN